MPEAPLVLKNFKRPEISKWNLLKFHLKFLRWKSATFGNFSNILAGRVRLWRERSKRSQHHTTNTQMHYPAPANTTFIPSCLLQHSLHSRVFILQCLRGLTIPITAWYQLNKRAKMWKFGRIVRWLFSFQTWKHHINPTLDQYHGGCLMLEEKVRDIMYKIGM